MLSFKWKLLFLLSFKKPSNNKVIMSRLSYFPMWWKTLMLDEKIDALSSYNPIMMTRILTKKEIKRYELDKTFLCNMLEQWQNLKWKIKDEKN